MTTSTNQENHDNYIELHVHVARLNLAQTLLNGAADNIPMLQRSVEMSQNVLNVTMILFVWKQCFGK